MNVHVHAITILPFRLCLKVALWKFAVSLWLSYRFHQVLEGIGVEAHEISAIHDPRVSLFSLITNAQIVGIKRLSGPLANL
jgi:hypothetical protein